MLHSILVLDYGGVLGEHYQEPAESELSTILGITKQRLRELLSERSEQGQAFREDRMTEDEFWDRIATLVGMPLSNRPHNSLLSRLWAETYKLNQQVLSIIHAVRTKIPVGIITNIDRARSNYLIDKVGILSFIDIYLPSYQFRTIKPAKEIWLTANAEIHSRFGTVKIFYVDDRSSHIEAAKQFAGWYGILYVNPNQLKEKLCNLGFNTT